MLQVSYRHSKVFPGIAFYQGNDTPEHFPGHSAARLSSSGTMSCGAHFGCPVALGFVLAGLIHTGVNAGKGSQHFSVAESVHITVLSDSCVS